MVLRFEAVIVQKLPASPVYSEHSLVTTRLPPRAVDAEATACPLVRAPLSAGAANPAREGLPLGLVGDAPPPVQATALAQRAPSATVFRMISIPLL